MDNSLFNFKDIWIVMGTTWELFLWQGRMQAFFATGAAVVFC
jgi:hypothetical protein